MRDNEAVSSYLEAVRGMSPSGGVVLADLIQAIGTIHPDFSPGALMSSVSPHFCDRPLIGAVASKIVLDCFFDPETGVYLSLDGLFAWDSRSHKFVDLREAHRRDR